ncbi:putative potassium channel, voltage-dependent, ERG [Rosa chinensis]|uniref:Putative potassium channel, voltage-dependent, ERG n=1 Tax=Rosa chinensis TaxID=74649 RepID=A0A2P6QTS2_ROSCH|nr:putative cyclic nucleotide-gated ion channel 13 isoform X2 [Rosa chinensis]PRQ37590.1 putative potassium channel, voltage-dependent, ERG [Rosa chinensis]
MQKVSKSNTIRQKMKMIDIRSILNEYGSSDENHEMERKIKLAVKDKLKEDDNHIVENMFSILSLEEAENFAMKIKCSLFMDKLKKVDGLKDKEEEVLKKICEHLEPMIYNKGCYIIREGEPLDMMFLSHGVVYSPMRLIMVDQMVLQVLSILRKRKMVCMVKSF